MADTVNNLISNAYYLSGVVSREFETVSGSQIYDGLNWLNDIIGEKVVDEGMIPYETKITLNSVIGQEDYFIPDLIQINVLTFFKDTVRYSMKHQSRSQYFGSARVESINSLPFNWYAEREYGGARLYLYFHPDEAYPLEINGIFRLSEVALGDDLALTLDRFYRTYLRYALADRICTEFSYNTPDNLRRHLSRYESLINKKSRKLDMSVEKQSTLQKGTGGINWAYANLGRGWTV
jgi:hypothetical protein